MRKIWMLQIVLLVSGLLVATLIAEIATRLVFPEAVDDRLLLTTSVFVRDAKGIPRLAPRQRVRSVLFASGRPEFDVTYTTNNLGFVDHRDYIRNPEAWAMAVAGDSFAAGVEANRPWLPVFRDNVRATAPEVEIYNFGTGGAGVGQFFQILDSAADELSFDAVMLVAIGDDFYRAPWVPRQEGRELYLCGATETPHDCTSRRPIAYMMAADEDSADRVRGVPASPVAQRPAWRAFLRRSRFLVTLKRTVDQYRPPGATCSWRMSRHCPKYGTDSRNSRLISCTCRRSAKSRAASTWRSFAVTSSPPACDITTLSNRAHGPRTGSTNTTTIQTLAATRP